MSTFLDVLSELTTPFYVTDDYDPRPAFLAAAVMQQFYTPMSPRPSYQPLLIQHMEQSSPLLFPSCYHPEDVVVLSTLAALLQHETGIAEFADIGPAMLTLKIKTIIWMWLEVSGSTVANVLDIDMVKIIQALTDYAPTRGALEEAVASIPRSLFRTGLNHLNAAVSELENPTFTFLPNRLLANMRGIGAICMVPLEEWPVEKYGAYHFVLAISEELRLLLKDEVDKPHALLEALNGRLFYSIRCALHHFGRSLLTPCGRMPFLLGYIWHWSMKSRRVAHKVLMELNDMRSFVGSWNELPQMPSGNLLTVGWHVFVTHFDRSVQASPESGRLRTMCMNPTVRFFFAR
ncbi:hypothetical protein CPB85DRAFT_1353638 [Mucidula mucida]|nr:hypothetical protein CPB85DRAFT_1353638 [Mucidula mucida]